MNEVYKQPNTQNTSAMNEQYRFLCLNKKPQSYNFDNNSFSIPNDAIKALGELGKVLSGIHTRMKRDGYIIEDGIIVKKV